MRYVSTRTFGDRKSAVGGRPPAAGAPATGDRRPAGEDSAVGDLRRAIGQRIGRDGVTLRQAMLDGLAPDGGLYVPEHIPVWSPDEVAALSSISLAETGARVLAPFAGEEVAPARLRAIAGEALDFPIPLVEVEPGVYALELFHGPTLAFKDVAARVMARLFAALRESDERLTILVATSGDTGGAVAHAFAGVTGTRVLVLYPAGRVSPTQEAQLTAFNSEAANVRAYAVDGSFDDCQRLVKGAFADADLRQQVRLTSANSINVGRLLPQMIFYFNAIGQLAARLNSRAMSDAARLKLRGTDASNVARDFNPALIATPSGNFGNLTAGVMAKRSGVPIERFIAATNVNDVVPTYLKTGRYEPRPSIATIANAMDVGNPSNFERLLWVYGNDVEAMRGDITGSVHRDADVRETIRRVYETRGYLLDPHSAIGYLAVTHPSESVGPGVSRPARPQIFLATAHPAKFREIVEPIVGRAIDIPAPLAAALAKPRRIVRMEPSLAGLRRQILG